MWLIIDDKRELKCDVIARTARAGIALLESNEWECVCLDHDLGDANSMTGYDVCKWALDSKCLPFKVQLVTSNPVGRNNMANLLRDAGYKSKDGFNFSKD